MHEHTQIHTQRIGRFPLNGVQCNNLDLISTNKFIQLFICCKYLLFFRDYMLKHVLFFDCNRVCVCYIILYTNSMYILYISL